MNQPIPNNQLKWFRSALLIFLIAMTGLHMALAWKVRDGLRKGYQDFTIFYSAGKTLNLGLGDHLYDDEVQWQIQQTFAPWVTIRKGPLPYNHPPFEALLFAPFARLPFLAAFLCWDLLNVAILTALPFFLRPYIKLLQRVSALWFVLASVAVFPVCVSLIQGQDTILMLLVFALAYVALSRNSDFFAGCFLGLGLFRFHQVLPVVLILWLGRRVKTTFGFALSGIVFGLVSLRLVGWHALLKYPVYLWRVENDLQRGPIVPLDMPTLRGFLYATLSSHAPLILINLLIAGLSLGLIVFTASKWRSAADQMNLDMSYSLCLISSFLVSYHAYAYELTALLLPALLVVNHLFVNWEYPNWKRIKLYLPLFLFFFTPLQMLLCLRYGHFHFFALVLVLWVWGISDEMARTSGTQLPTVQSPQSA